MKIGGFQKFSLLDYPGQLAAIVFTQGCNFRCPYCHNPQLVDPERFGKCLDTDKILDFLISRVGKLGAVSITGGEPTIQPNLIPFLAKLKKHGYLVKLDTNGSRPDVIKELSEQGLVDYWAMDIKAPEDLYPLLTRSTIPVDNILKSMEILRHSRREYEFRTTFFESLFSWSDINRIQNMLRPGDRYYLQECRYTDTLEDVGTAKTRPEDICKVSFKHLTDDPACLSLIRWGDQHHVNIFIRTL
jgi:pyruvate formate lyase activating enzyme